MLAHHLSLSQTLPHCHAILANHTSYAIKASGRVLPVVLSHSPVINIVALSPLPQRILVVAIFTGSYHPIGWGGYQSGREGQMAFTTSRANALGLSTDLEQAGAVYNDATRLLDGGLFTTPTDSNNQAAYLGSYQSDVHAVLSDINAVLANPGATMLGGAAFTLTTADTAVLHQVAGQLNTLLQEAPLAAGSDSAAAGMAQQVIHTDQVAILTEINGDTHLANALAGHTYMGSTGALNVGFQALPALAADSATALAAATAAGATLKEIGTVFNAAANLAVGGLNPNNGTLTEFNNDMTAVEKGLTNLINNPTQLAALEAGETATAAALTTIHLDTVANEVNLQINTFDQQFANNTNIQQALRGTNDNVLDIIDIVQNDTALNMNAGGNGMAASVGGFAEQPAFLTGTTQRYQDNQAQTNFWAQFIAEGDTINNELDAVAATPGGFSTTQLQALVTQIQNYDSFASSFEVGSTAATGPIQGARFLNELTGGTALADTTNAVHGLTGILNHDTGAALAADVAQIKAAGMGFVADANDVDGNNVPIGGGHYVQGATTVAAATSANGLAQGTTNVGPVANALTGLSTGTTQTATGGTTGTTTTTPPPATTGTTHMGGHGGHGGHGGGMGGPGGGTGGPGGGTDHHIDYAMMWHHA
ncbi:MAG TPA: hypothetical protein VGJ20_34815 [Xanthobacteraceae bacterium]